VGIYAALVRRKTRLLKRPVGCWKAPNDAVIVLLLFGAFSFLHEEKPSAHGAPA
jgi:hypothetical protein